MDFSKRMESEPQNECELPNYSSASSKLTESLDNNSVQDDVKIKVEIELKEAENDLVYETDFYGHLRLVNINQIASDTNSDIKNKDTASISGPKKKSSRLSNAEKQRLYRQRRKNNSQRDEEAKKKDRERYHKRKKLAHQLSEKDLYARRKRIRERVRQYRKNKRNSLRMTSSDSPYEDQPHSEEQDSGGSVVISQNKVKLEKE